MPDNRLPVMALNRRLSALPRWLRNEFGQLIDESDPFRAPMFSWTREEVFPVIDLEEDEKGYRLKAEVPGYDRDQIDLSIVDGGIVVKGAKQESSERREEGLIVRERHQGRFERRVQLPGDFNADGIEARLDRGLLEVTIPKAPEPAQRKVEIKVD